MAYKHKDYSAICRICMSRGDGMESIFDTKKSLNSKLMYVTNLQVSKDDGLPTVICQRCCLRLNSAHRFKQQSIASDSVLRAEFPHLQLTEDDLPLVELYSTTTLVPSRKDVQSPISRLDEMGDLPTVNFEDGVLENLLDSADKKEGILDMENIDYVKPENNFVNFELATEVDFAVTFIKEEVVELCDEPDFDLMLCEAMYSENQPEDSSSDVKGVLQGQWDAAELNLANKPALTINRRKRQHVVRKEFLSDEEVTADTFIMFRQSQEPTGKVVLSIPKKLQVGTVEEQKAKRLLARRLRRAEMQLFNIGKRPKVPPQPCVCHVCGKTYLGKSNLAQHLLYHRNERRYKCVNCNFAFNSKGHLKRHTLSQKCTKPGLLNGEGAFQCAVCKKTFSIKVAMVSHMKCHTETAASAPQECKVCGKVFKGRVRLKQHLNSHSTERPYKCKVCERGFTYRSHLTRHMIIHTNEKTNQCYKCGKCFSSYSHMRDHLIAHSDARPFKCRVPKCDKTFKRREGFKLHMKRHLGLKPHQCDKCDASFLQVVHLRRHQRIHTGERPFVCNLCPKTFGRKHHLEAHIRSHTGEMLFTCDICQNSYVHKVSLIAHFKNHHK